MEKMKKYVPDTSVIVNQEVLNFIKDNSRDTTLEIIIPEVVLAEIEYQANIGKKIGKIGILTLESLRRLNNEGKIVLKFSGNRPSLDAIKLAIGGELDALIRNEAKTNQAILLSGDKIQVDFALIEGINAILLREKVGKPKYLLENIFKKNMMSIHLKEGNYPLAKIGSPSYWDLVKIGEEKLRPGDLDDLIHYLLKKSKKQKDSFLEIEKEGVYIIQFREFRVVITQPPFSKKLEITAVKPLVKLKFEDYKLPKEIIKRLRERAEGILIAGAVGSGKSTFASALAEFYFQNNKIVKTLEKPRDLQVSKGITQYTKDEKDIEKIYDILLLVRPDFVIFDEIRKTGDFKIYSDLRLSGIGLVGVIHGSRPIDAIQRFLSRVELGLISNIIDTIIYLNKGIIQDIYTLKTLVRVPSGMRESDLARPIVEVRDINNILKYEIYTYGEQTIIIEIDKRKAVGSSVQKLAIERIKDEIEQVIPNTKFDVFFTSKDQVTILLNKADIPHLIGKKGKVIDGLEKKLGIKIDIAKGLKKKSKRKK
ncbi:MAG: ATPase, T2SS/T4P/T4SS family [Candidatus Helarchaeota archaeon]